MAAVKSSAPDPAVAESVPKRPSTFVAALPPFRATVIATALVPDGTISQTMRRLLPRGPTWAAVRVTVAVETPAVQGRSV